MFVLTPQQNWRPIADLFTHLQFDWVFERKTFNSMDKINRIPSMTLFKVHLATMSLADKYL